jgi:hypothetical protein
MHVLLISSRSNKVCPKCVEKTVHELGQERCELTRALGLYMFAYRRTPSRIGNVRVIKRLAGSWTDIE